MKVRNNFIMRILKLFSGSLYLKMCNLLTNIFSIIKTTQNNYNIPLILRKSLNLLKNESLLMISINTITKRTAAYIFSFEAVKIVVLFK